MVLDVPIQILREGARAPEYMTEHAAGMDMYAALEKPMTLAPGERRLVPTGIAMAIPVGYEGQVRPRSGLALKKGISLVNSPGTIDADYRGEIGVIVINQGQEAVTFQHGDRIAQMVIAPVPQVTLKVVDSLDETTRNAGGFGHTGVESA